MPQTPPLLPAAAPGLSAADPKDKIGQGAEANSSELPEENSSDLFSASVSELRRKAQEHSAALWQLAQTVQQQQQQQQEQQEQSNFVLDSDSDVKRNSDDDNDDDGGGGGEAEAAK